MKMILIIFQLQLKKLEFLLLVLLTSLILSRKRRFHILIQNLKESKLFGKGDCSSQWSRGRKMEEDSRRDVKDEKIQKYLSDIEKKYVKINEACSS
ncbi:hypothetical protein RCL_jg8735.t1 [Rhizophagus clarus]|uniref:Uncharacterized protein n=1 Tax=Rhizophagus clarus TaxID=94130 RepID=A0A8H3M3X9_9GLOM|nr:hypothetical protein RCL_jg8735.t1 [Rhizophagus clarus]